MEFFLWFWMLDKRWVCGLRPHLKYFTFIWIIPIMINIILATINIMWLISFSFSEYSKNQYVTVIKTVVDIISIVCSLKMIFDTYSNSKIEILNTINGNNKENIILKSDIFKLKEDDEFWISRKSLLTPNGIILLLMSISQIAWSIFYLSNQELFIYNKEVLKYLILSNAYTHIILSTPVILLFFFACFFKVTFFLSANFCVGCVIKIADSCCKNRSDIKRKIDFSDVEVLEPEFV